MSFKIKVLLIGAFICYACLFKGQNKLTGTIRSADSSAVGGALVILPDLKARSMSDEKGNFVIYKVPKGYHRLQVINGGYSNYSTIVFVNDSVTYKNIKLSPDISLLDEIVVYGEQESKRSETANTIEVMDAVTMRELGAMSLSDGIARIPGVNQLTTGAGISKPVIRGLFGNRIQTVLLGMRFDNQQWQDEHGLGLSDIGVDKIEIIKGASSLFYGSEAMGGVLNIINEKAAPVNKLQADISTRFFSNTYGYGVDAGVKKSTQNHNWGIRLGRESHADYSDGNGNRILNSRFDGNIGKATFGFKYKRLVSENNYLFSQSNFGFLMDAYQVFDKPDERLARSFERPHHSVFVNMLSSQNTLFLKSSTLKINLGGHINNRQEQEGAGGISLDMFLQTWSALFLWTKDFSENFELSVGSQNQFQTNKNQGSRIIVPDANLAEGSLFAYLKKKSKFLVAEGGLRYDLKNIESLPTGVLNNGSVFNPGTNIVPVNRIYQTVNGAFGLSIFDNKHFNLKLNGTSGYRAPNLAELSSNGLHEGSVRYEIGNVDLKIEQNFCIDVYAEYYNKWFSVFANGYINHFLNYIYLQPDTTDYLGFRIYKYIQKDADIKGFEGGIKIFPIKNIQLSSTYSGILGQTSDGDYLPFIPAQKINNELKLKTKSLGLLKNPFISFNYIYVFAQETPNQFETTTASYDLLNAGAGTEFQGEKTKFIISVSGNNLLNEVYYDHLSRFKYFGIYNIGRSISLNLKLQFN
jgi:iron complex outermembrane receptor protein